MSEASQHAQTIRHFGHLAAHYDHRHHRYNQRTLTQALEALRLTDTARLLDVGCGTGELERLVHARYPQARLMGIDVTPQMLAVAREKFARVPEVAFAFAQAETLPFAPESFEAVVSCNMLHHVRAVDASLRECARVLRPGGQLVLVDWCRDFPHYRLMHYWLRLIKPSYVKMYRARELIEALRGVGCDVQDIHRFFVWPHFGMMRVSAIKRAS